jgi:hypothetical protein
MAGTVRFRRGDLFDVECDLVVLPCSTAGTVGRRLEQQLRRYDIPLPDPMEWGVVELIRHHGPDVSRVAYAAAVDNTGSSEAVLEKIGGGIADLARSLRGDISRIVVPLLGTGAGGVPFVTAARALSRGFTRGACDAELVISVLDSDAYNLLVSDPRFQEAGAATPADEPPGTVTPCAGANGKAVPRAEEPPAPRNRVFISYSHKDREWLEQLRPHLKPLERSGALIWDDTRLKPGIAWQKEIETALASTRVGILLVSADFLASDFIIGNELPPLLEAAQKDGAVILSLILRPCGFVRNKSLAQFQAVNDPGTPLVQMRSAGREKIFDKVAQEVERALAG